MKGLRIPFIDRTEGFLEMDIEKSPEAKTFLDGVNSSYQVTSRELFKHGNELISLLRCCYKKNVIIKRGYVPENFRGITDTFLFVNLDMDIFEPQYQALRFFIPIIAPLGVILLHEYFPLHWVPEMVGIKRAVDEIAKEYDFVRMPIGDSLSIALTNKKTVK